MKKVILMGLMLVLVLAGCDTQEKTITIEEAKTLTDSFINETLLGGKGKAVINSVVEEKGLFKIDVAIEGQEEIVVSYLTKDGTQFFPNKPLDIEETRGEAAKAADAGNDAPPAVDAPKSDKPKVELFVMSHCPFGTQAEKGMLPVIETLGDKIDIEIKFCDYAMHDKKELDEQLNQVCIKEEYSTKFYSYLACFLENETFGAKCMKDNGINTRKIASCVATKDKEFKVTEMYNDKSTWSGGRFPKFEVDGEVARAYGVQGSPSLVINGVKVNSGRAPALYLETICKAFNVAPEECATELSSANPSAGFGYEEGTDGAAASCGS